MKIKRESHTGFRNGKLFCFNCGRDYEINYPQPIGMVSAMMKQFDKDHNNCAKTWIEPVNETEIKTEEENAEWWRLNGEHGLSSKTMFNALSKIKIQNNYSCTPSDPDDFRRCYLLIKAVPQWKDKLNQLKTLGETWSNIVDNWDKLTEMLEDLMVKKKDNGMYDFMKSIGC